MKHYSGVSSGISAVLGAHCCEAEERNKFYLLQQTAAQYLLYPSSLCLFVTNCHPNQCFHVQPGVFCSYSGCQAYWDSGNELKTAGRSGVMDILKNNLVLLARYRTWESLGKAKPEGSQCSIERRVGTHECACKNIG